MERSEAKTDAVLLQDARRGDATAAAELKVRHSGVARRLAVTYVGRALSADEIVSAAFEQLLSAGDRGAAPDESFRAYLFVKVRNAAAALARQRRDSRPQGLIDLTIDAPDVAPPGNTRALVSRAFDQLSERHQVILWHATIEGAGPPELAQRFGMSADGAAALAYRAREDLRSAYLSAALEVVPRPACAPNAERLDAYARGSLRHRDRVETKTHVDTCASCQELLEELADVSVLLLRATVPLLLGFSLLTGLPPVEAPAVHSLRPPRGRRLALAREDDGPRRPAALAAVLAATLLVLVSGAAMALNRRHPAAGSRIATDAGISTTVGGAAGTVAVRQHGTRSSVRRPRATSTTVRTRHRHATTTSTVGHHGTDTGGGSTSSTVPRDRPTTSTATTRRPTSTTAPPTTAAPTTTSPPDTTVPTTEPPTTIPDTEPPP